MNLKSVIFPLFLFLATIANAQVSFTADASKTKLGVNERLRVDFTMNQDGDNFDPPPFTGFTVVAGPNQSISNTWINGRSSYKKTYSYYLQPNQTGKFTIGQAEITINGKVYKTTPIEIMVSAAVASPNTGNSAESVASENIHLVAEISDTSPYLNEGITVVYKLYVSPQISVSNWRPIDNPTYADFWSQNIDINRLQPKQGMYKGEAYRYVVLRKTVLYPQKTGKLEMEPLRLSVTVDVPTDKFDIFGRRQYERIDKIIAAGGQSISVKPLPNQGKPTSFTGAVGDFEFKVSPSKRTLKASESLRIDVEVSGKGNLKLFDLPKLTVPSALELYDPEHSEDVSTNLNGMYGNITDSYTVVPRAKGKYPIPPLEFSYFDPETASYKTLKSEEIVLNVEAGPKIPLAVGNNLSEASNKQPIVAANQFRYIKLDANLKPLKEKHFFGSKLFWILLIAPLVLIPFIIFFGKKYREKAGDITGNRLKKADKLARKYLSAAKKNLGNKKAFYEALELALHNYLKAKLHIQTSEMSKTNIKELLLERGAQEETSQEFIALLENCEYARYAPSSQVEMREEYQRAASVISHLDKQISK
ncbi:MAG TPA: BatD family protein [Flavobacteriaceae bacterium]|nr:BatD family protein [Flavobacteriaceae bacterium]